MMAQSALPNLRLKGGTGSRKRLSWKSFFRMTGLGTTSAPCPSAAATDLVRRAEVVGILVGNVGRILGGTCFLLWYTCLGTSLPDFRAVLLILGFVALPALHLALLRSGRESRWHRYLIVALDAAAIGLVFTYVPLHPDGSVPQIFVFRSHGAAWLCLLLATSTLSLSPALTLWSGFTLVVALWSSFAIIVAGMKRTSSWQDLQTGYTGADYVALVTDASFVGRANRIEESLLLLVTAGILAMAAQCARALAHRAAMAEAERLLMARHLSPGSAGRIAMYDDPAGQVSTHVATVMFVDIADFTGFAESNSPEASMALLRRFHELVATEVERFGGTVEDFVGDEVFAVFGTPVPRHDDAAHAIECCASIATVIRLWNIQRARSGTAQIGYGVGIHTGSVVIGSTGTRRRKKVMIIGDTVNLASRLQAQTRETGRKIIISDATVQAAGLGSQISDRMTTLRIRGRSAQLQVRILDDDELVAELAASKSKNSPAASSTLSFRKQVRTA